MNFERNFPIYSIESSERSKILTKVKNFEFRTKRKKRLFFLSFFEDFSQTQSTIDGQQLAESIQILTVLIPHVHPTILDQVKPFDIFDRNHFDSFRFFSLFIY